MCEFLEQFNNYVFDIHCHLVVDEFRLQNAMEAVKVYTNKEMIKERMDFYISQDEFCANYSELYRLNFVVKGAKYQWKMLRSVLETSIQSKASIVFHECYICNREQVADVMSRDICAYVNTSEMMLKKHRNENYYGSKVLWYGEDVPDDYKEKKEEIKMEGRRVMEREGSS